MREFGLHRRVFTTLFAKRGLQKAGQYGGFTDERNCHSHIHWTVEHPGVVEEDAFGTGEDNSQEATLVLARHYRAGRAFPHYPGNRCCLMCFQREEIYVKAAVRLGLSFPGSTKSGKCW